jgi:transposase InsO family protein
VNHLRERLTQEPVREGPPPRGFAGQRAEREQEQTVRRHVVETSERIVEQGWTQQQAAEFFNLSARTLRLWRHEFANDLLVPRPLGRPILAATREQRNEIFRTIDELGPGIGLPTLRDMFAGVARAELDDILRRYRLIWRQLNQQPIHVLEWTRPGRVWAIDFHGPRPGVDGLFPYLFAVRDLGSGRQLLWRPVQAMTADVARREMETLLVIHGAPLLLKCDNGSAFIDGGFRAGVSSFGVEILFSPPRTPSYNGSIEAGIGSLTSRTDQHAARHGHPGHWIWDDVEAALAEANATARPFGELGLSPDAVWTSRTPIDLEERLLFQRTVEARRQEVLDAQGRPLATLQDAAAQRATDRQAIRQVLVELGYLYMTRRRITLPIRKKKTASNM